jgi:3-deoxy-D-manno-octulosonate 8-phosphate phosphatase (KDO 8-P phosphatase)
MLKKDLVFVLDFDGILTDGKMYYTKEGKYLKCFGPDDFDLLKELSNFIKVNIITADKRGFPITQKRIVEEMGLKLDLVSGKPHERWEWIREKYPIEHIIFMGDGWADYYSLKQANLGITVVDALDHVKKSADIIIQRKGGERAVAETILFLLDKYKIYAIIE